MRYSISTICTATMAIVMTTTLPALGQPLVTPPPRDVVWTDQRFDLVDAEIQAAGPQEQQVARLLASEMQRVRGVKLREKGSGTFCRNGPEGASHKRYLTPFPARSSPGPSPLIKLVLAGSAGADAIFKKMAGKANWPPPRNGEEGYLLEVGPREATVFAKSQRGLVYGCQTLMQLAVPSSQGKAKQLLGTRIVDYPQLAFRGVHICIFPNTELAAVRQMILLAARFKYNAVVIEFWSSLKSKKRPETAYEHAYSPEQIRPLVCLGHALGMDMIPMLNSWGHASGMRSRSGEHVVLDRHPELKDLYEADGWSFCLSNPELYNHLFDRYDELLELFAPTRYFHLGLDEAWGHRGLKEDKTCRGDEPRELIVRHLHKLHEYFAKRDVRVLMWHDMFLQRNHPELGRQSPANSVPPFNTHLVLPELPRDVILAAWNYSNTQAWPVPKYFHDKGFPVVVCPWKTKGNTALLVDGAKEHDLLGLLATTWDSLDVSQPSVGRAGVLAWTPPGYDLAAVPFDHWLGAIRTFPICDLPLLEQSLTAADTAK